MNIRGRYRRTVLYSTGGIQYCGWWNDRGIRRRTAGRGGGGGGGGGEGRVEQRERVSLNKHSAKLEGIES